VTCRCRKYSQVAASQPLMRSCKEATKARHRRFTRLVSVSLCRARLEHTCSRSGGQAMGSDLT